MRMTPLELDVQLQTAELVFRSILEGKRVPLTGHENIESWEKEVLGEQWSLDNEVQRKEVHRQVKADGESSPAWMEALGHMGDIAWEVFEAGSNGERMRPLETLDRAEIVEQFKDLRHKVKMSYYAKCGAGDKVFGFRACVALLRTCIRDSEVLELMVSVLIECVKDHPYNRDGLACLTTPAPPLERGMSFQDRGWSFLRNALDAFVVQAGGNGYSSTHGEQPQAVMDGPAERERPEVPGPKAEVALLIAECLVGMRNAPAVLAQLKLVHEEPPENCWIERRELKEIIPIAKATCEDLIISNPSCEFLTMLRDMLVEGEEYVARAPAPSAPSADASSEMPSTDALVVREDARDASSEASDEVMPELMG